MNTNNEKMIEVTEHYQNGELVDVKASGKTIWPVSNTNTVEEIIENLPTNICRECRGDGYSVEHDPYDPTGQTPMQVQCDYCHAEGKITTLDVVHTALTTLTQHHQAELAEVYREILSVRNVDIIYASDIKTIAEKRGIDISDKKTDHE